MPSSLSQNVEREHLSAQQICLGLLPKEHCEKISFLFVPLVLLYKRVILYENRISSFCKTTIGIATVTRKTRIKCMIWSTFQSSRPTCLGETLCLLRNTTTLLFGMFHNYWTRDTCFVYRIINVSRLIIVRHKSKSVVCMSE